MCALGEELPVERLPVERLPVLARRTLPGTSRVGALSACQTASGSLNRTHEPNDDLELLN